MLVEVDHICRRHDIKYVISYGTLLGAIRHGGFIPWDYDSDICMLREEYEKFKRVANELDPDICYFQDHDTDENYLWSYGNKLIAKIPPKFVFDSLKKHYTSKSRNDLPNPVRVLLFSSIGKHYNHNNPISTRYGAKSHSDCVAENRCVGLLCPRSSNEKQKCNHFGGRKIKPLRPFQL